MPTWVARQVPVPNTKDIPTLEIVSVSNFPLSLWGHPNKTQHFFPFWRLFFCFYWFRENSAEEPSGKFFLRSWAIKKDGGRRVVVPDASENLCGYVKGLASPSIIGSSDNLRVPNK